MASTGGVATAICALVLLIAGASKLNDLHGFSQQVVMYKVLPSTLAHGVGHLLPRFEVALGAAMLFAPTVSVLAAALFIGFALAVGLNVLRGRTELRCACFGVRGARTVTWTHVLTNISFALAAGWSAAVHRSPSLSELQIGVSIVAVAALLETWRSVHAEILTLSPAESR